MESSTARKVYRLLTPSQRKDGAVLFVLMVIGMGLETLGITLVVPAVALLSQSDPAVSYPQLRPLLDWMNNPSQSRLIASGMIALAVIVLIKALFLSFLAWRQTRFSLDVQADLSRRLFGVYLRQPYTFFLNSNSSLLIRNSITEVGQFTTGVLTPGLTLLTEALVLSGIATVLFLIEPVATMLVVATTGVAALAFHYGTRTLVADWGLRRQRAEGLRLQHLQQGLAGAKEVKLLGRESHFLRIYDKHNRESANATRLKLTLAQLPLLWLETLAIFGLGIVVFVGLARGGEPGRVVPMVALFAAAAFRLMPSLNRIVSALQSLRFGGPVIDVLHHELNLHVDEPEAVGPIRLDPQVIEVSALSYTYPGVSRPTLDYINVTIRGGECVGIVGPSGAGKSTLVDLILGLLTPSEGYIRVNGQDVQAHLRAWQSRIGYVPQTIYLTDDTLRRNVAFGLADEEIDDAAVHRALAAANLEAFVLALPHGLDSEVGERGVRLSGGQRQRIGVARALYANPAVLVLDEATSALDLATERGVMDAVDALHGERTVIIVSHRASTVERCDRIYKLEAGRLTGERLEPSVV